MKNIVYCSIIFCLVSIHTGCYKDLSSNRYEPFGQISIEGIESSYSLVSYIDVLTIDPAVSSTDPSDRFTYTWTLYSNANLSSIAAYTPVDTIGHEKTLNYPVNLAPGAYTIVLHVTNATNGFKAYQSATLNTGTPFSTGYYFLKETAAGKTEIDFRNPAGEMVYDLLETCIGAPMEGTPNRLTIYSGYSYTDPVTTQRKSGRVLFPTTTREAKVILVDDISEIYDYDAMYYGDKPIEIPLYLFKTIFYPIYASSIGTYINSGSGKYGLPSTPAGGCSYSKYIVTNENGMVAATLFDDADPNNGRFVKVDYNNNVQTLTQTNDYSFSGIREKLMFMSANTGGLSISSGRAIFRDRTDPLLNNLYTLSFGSTSNTVTNIQTLNPELNFCKAHIYGANKSDATMMLYGGVGDKIYMYNTASEQEKLLTPEGMGSGEEITLITHKNGQGTYLIIATYRAGNYKVYMYATSGGEPYGEPAIVVEGVGKVIDLQHTATSYGYANL